MRTIKFRAWDGGKMINMPLTGAFGLYRFFGLITEDSIIMQFTGLKDKNGREIYEGDIAKITYSIVTIGDTGTYEHRYTDIGVMEFNQKDAFFGFLVEGSLFDKDTQDLVVEIIGNIYENPNLLTTPWKR